MTTQFETSKAYGNDLTVTVLSRTEKTVTIDTGAWGVKRIKVKEYTNGVECVYFKAWIITANELFNTEESLQNSLERAYY